MDTTQQTLLARAIEARSKECKEECEQVGDRLLEGKAYCTSYPDVVEEYRKQGFSVRQNGNLPEWIIYPEAAK